MTVAPPEQLVVRGTTTGGRFEVRVSARASRTGLSGPRDGRLVVRVSAPPVDGAANDAVIRLVAATLGLPARQVELVAGLQGRTKTLDVHGLAAGEIARRWTEATR